MLIARKIEARFKMILPFGVFSGLECVRQAKKVAPAVNNSIKTNNTIPLFPDFSVKKPVLGSMVNKI